jgi:hypothetical protein
MTRTAEVDVRHAGVVKLSEVQSSPSCNECPCVKKLKIGDWIHRLEG